MSSTLVPHLLACSLAMFLLVVGLAATGHFSDQDFRWACSFLASVVIRLLTRKATK